MINRSFLYIFLLLGLFSCGRNESSFSYKPIKSEKPLLVSELGEKLEIIEVRTKYPISGTPKIFKSDKYFYLFEEGIVVSLHQVDFDGNLRKSIHFGFDDKLNGLAITQILIKEDRVGVVENGDKVTWFDENLEEVEVATLPAKAKFHFLDGNQTIAYTHGIDDGDWDILVYDSVVKIGAFPINRERYQFYNNPYSPIARWNEQVIFSKAFNDTVYIWKDQSFQPFLYVDFGSEKIDEERYLQIRGALDMQEFFKEGPHNYFKGEIWGLDSSRILFQVSSKARGQLAILDLADQTLIVYPGFIDNSVSMMNLRSPQFSQDGELFFGISGEEIEEHIGRAPDGFKMSLSADYAESYFIYRLKIKS
jgi:hypothetical protein